MPLNNNGENFRGGGELEIEEMKFNGKKMHSSHENNFFSLAETPHGGHEGA